MGRCKPGREVGQPRLGGIHSRLTAKWAVGKARMRIGSTQNIAKWCRVNTDLKVSDCVAKFCSCYRFGITLTVCLKGGGGLKLKTNPELVASPE